MLCHKMKNHIWCSIDLSIPAKDTNLSKSNGDVLAGMVPWDSRRFFEFATVLSACL
jgi:hypothetical protein